VSGPARIGCWFCWLRAVNHYHVALALVNLLELLPASSYFFMFRCLNTSTGVEDSPGVSVLCVIVLEISDFDFQRVLVVIVQRDMLRSICVITVTSVEYHQ
jgi:hypothetical protein